MKPATIATLALGAAFVIVALFLATNHGPPAHPASSSVSSPATAPENPNGEQVVEILAKGGYTPAIARAKAEAPLLLKIKTDGTFDCSAEVRIPGIGWSQNLNSTGEVSVQIPAQKPGTILTGVCSMGMYNFKITFD